MGMYRNIVNFEAKCKNPPESLLINGDVPIKSVTMHLENGETFEFEPIRTEAYLHLTTRRDQKLIITFEEDLLG
jgi:hypothetical protein